MWLTAVSMESDETTQLCLFSRMGFLRPRAFFGVPPDGYVLALHDQYTVPRLGGKLLS